MSSPFSPSGLLLQSVAWLITGLALGGAFLSLPWAYARPYSRLGDPSRQHLWCAAVVILACLWAFSGWAQDGPVLHPLGAALLCALFGWRLALLALYCVVALATLALDLSFADTGIRLIAFAIAPVAATACVQTGLARFRSDRHGFVIGHGTVAAAVSVLASQGCLFALRWLLDLRPAPASGGLLFYIALLLVGECLLNGGLAAVLATMRPAWLKSTQAFTPGSSARRR